MRAFRHCGIGALFHRLSSSAPQNHLTSGQTLEQKQAEQAAKPSQAACSPRGWVGDAVEGRRDDEGGGADPHHDVEVIVRLLERRGVHVHIRRRRLHTLRATSSEPKSRQHPSAGGTLKICVRTQAPSTEEMESQVSRTANAASESFSRYLPHRPQHTSCAADVAASCFHLDQHVPKGLEAGAYRVEMVAA